MSNDIVRNHWKYQTSWTDGFKCSHVKLQAKPPSTILYSGRRFNSPSRISQSSSAEHSPRSDSRSTTRYDNTNQTTALQKLDRRREQRVSRRKPWSEKQPKAYKANRNVYIETFYENYLPSDVDLDDLRLQSRKYVANSRYGNIYQVKYNRNKIPTNTKTDGGSTWMWEKDYNVWLHDQQRTQTGRSSPMLPTYVSTTTMTPRGINVGHCTTRNQDGYCNINLKSSTDTIPNLVDKTPIPSTGSTPRNMSLTRRRSLVSTPRLKGEQDKGQSLTSTRGSLEKTRLGKSIVDRPDAELFAHYNAYRLNKQERRSAAIKIQSVFRGYSVRLWLDKLKRKVVLDHGRSWKNFISDYKELISRIRSRYGIMRNSCAIVLKEVDSFIDMKYNYERKFDITATEGKLLKENLGDFFENCKLHPTEGDVISTFNKIYHGTCCSAEVVFVLDCSTSIGTLGFRRLIQFVKDVILTFEVASDRVRVGVLPFNEDIFQSFSIFTYQSKHDILNAIDEIRLKHGLTRTHLAIKEMNNMLSNSRPGVRKVGVVITDGKSSEPGYTEIEAKRAHVDGVNVYTIGVGGSVDMEELKTLANQDDNVFFVSSYNTLTDLTDAVANTILGNREDSFESWKQGKCRPLSCTESMEILWTLYPPPAANLNHIHRSRWIRPIIQGTEAWTMMDDKVKSNTDMRSCLRIVVQARIHRYGHVMLPSKDSNGVDYITDVDKAVSIIEEWMKVKQK